MDHRPGTQQGRRVPIQNRRSTSPAPAKKGPRMTWHELMFLLILACLLLPWALPALLNRIRNRNR